MPTDGADRPSDSAVVEAAATAAEEVIFSRCSRGAVEDLDVTVTFEDGVLEVDVFLDTDESGIDADQVADDAALAARAAADDLLE